MKENNNQEDIKEKNKDNKIEDNPAAKPLGMMLDKARDELGGMVFRYMNMSGIPASLFDYILSDIVAKVKDLKSVEYAEHESGD